MSRATYLREKDVAYLLTTVAEGDSASLVGLSNTGKSVLLRTLCQREAQTRVLGKRADHLVFIYVDCNLMLTLTPQGFYEVTLRAAQEVLKQIDAPDALVTCLNDQYHKVVEPASEFGVPLAFNEAIDQLNRQLARGIVFLFDEFDEPFAKLDSRVFLNLRALSDKFGKHLTYVVATTTPLAARSSDSDVSEFVELFVGHQRMLSLLNGEEASALANELARAESAELDRQALDFILDQAGGHAGLIRAVARVVLATASGLPENARAASLTLVRQRLEDDQVARAECSKLWASLTEAERDALVDFVLDPAVAFQPALWQSLVDKGILLPGEPLRVFGQHFTGFVRRQRRARKAAQAGVWLDVDSGNVTVDGRPIPTLTDLEYRLLLLLWGRLDKICDKYQIVENVWGQDYIDEVDDARIEKLVSRLRAKLELDPTNPRYLQTVRGRGYRLAGV